MFYTMYRHVSSSSLIEKIPFTFGVIILALGLAFSWKQWKMAKAFRHFPSKRLDMEWTWLVILGRYPKDIPFTSFIFQLLRKTANEFREEGLCVIWLLKPLLFVFSEKYTKDLVNNPHLVERGTGSDMNKLMFGNGLLGSRDDTWRVHRKLLNPAFSAGAIKDRIHLFNKYAIQLVDKLETLVDKPSDDTVHHLKYCAFQNMADFVVGLKLDNEKHISMFEAFMQIVDLGGEVSIERICRPWLHWDFTLPFFPLGRKYLKIVNGINSQVAGIINELKERNMESDREHTEDDSDDERNTTIWDILQNHVFAEKDVRDEIVSLAAAGYDTVSVTLLWCFYTLGRHPEVQKKVYSELQSVVPKGDITYENLAELKYLECVIKETLRLYLTGPIYERTANEDIKCGEYTITKGTSVCLFAFELHRDPEVFPEPEKFDPERFWDSSKLRPWMYIPFFESYRNCIGKKFAMTEMKVTLAQVLRRFRITCLNKIDDNEFHWTITLKPAKPLQFLIENRQSKS